MCHTARLQARHPGANYFMAEKTETLEMQVEGKKVRLTHLDKVLFPASGFRKADLIDYYAKVSRYILPHLIDRPLTLKMYATGVTGKAQYIKDALSFTPKWIKRALQSQGAVAVQIYAICSSMTCHRFSG